MLVPSFARTWPTPVDVKMTFDGTFYSFREHQQQAYDKLAKQSAWALNMPTGSGKSLVIMSLVHRHLRDNPGARVIIAVPQSAIGIGFRDCKLRYPDGFEMAWSLPTANDLTLRGEAKIEELRQWITSKQWVTSPDSVMNRVMLCTHQTATLLLSQEPELLTPDIGLVVDEAHHLMNAEVQNSNEVVSNGIGSAALQALEQGSFLGIVTATMMRWDRLALLPKQADSEIVRYELPIDEYLATCKFIRGLKYSYALYERTWEKTLSEYYDPSRRLVIHIPPVNSAASRGKVADVQTVFRAIAGCDDPEVECEGPVTKVRRGSEWIRILNLVDAQDRDLKKEYLAVAREDRDAIHAIVALNMFKEGTDWPWADRGVIIGPRGSQPGVIQMMGRLLRDVEGKSVIETLHMIPHPRTLDTDEIKQVLESWVSSVILALMLEETFFPEKLPAERRYRQTSDAIPDMTERARFTEGLIREAMDLLGQGKSDDEVVSRLYASAESGHGLSPEEAIDAVDSVLALLTRKTKELRGNGNEHLLGVLEEWDNPIACVLAYTSGFLDEATFRGFRKLSYPDEWTKEEIRERMITHGVRSSKDFLRRRKSGEVWALELPRFPIRYLSHRGIKAKWWELLGKSAPKEWDVEGVRRILAKHDVVSENDFLRRRKSGEVWALELPCRPVHYFERRKVRTSWWELLGREKLREWTEEEFKEQLHAKGVSTSKEYLRRKKAGEEWMRNLPATPVVWFAHRGVETSWMRLLGKTKPREWTETEISDKLRSHNVRGGADFRRRKKAGEEWAIDLPLHPNMYLKHRGIVSTWKSLLRERVWTKEEISNVLQLHQVKGRTDFRHRRKTGEKWAVDLPSVPVKYLANKGIETSWSELLGKS